jgi:sterol desaturase/sphingolipid hydroxylase (fatty acid hydroxylase superfamily)
MNLYSLFGAERISLSNIDKLEKSAPDIIVYAMPFMFLFVLVEYIVSRIQSDELYDKRETLGSTLVGLGNVAIGVSLKTTLLFIFILVYNLLPWRMEFRWWTLIPCYVILDFCSYWAHRVSHHVRILWGTHVAHHSGEHYNLTVSFRLSWVQYVKLIFFLPLALIGFHPVIIFVSNLIAVLFQFWVHTEYIRKLHPVIEYLFATPSNHRVHHGSQQKYINKNFGATFIIWDRIFGTYQPEEEQVVYGITHNIESKHDPIHINFHEYVDMVSDVRQAKNLREKLLYIFGDPEEVAKFKVQKAERSEHIQASVDTRSYSSKGNSHDQFHTHGKHYGSRRD